MTLREAFERLQTAPDDPVARATIGEACTALSHRRGVVPEHAQEAAAQVVLELFTEAADLRLLIPDRPEAWLFRRIRNRAIDLYRRAKRIGGGPPGPRGASGVAGADDVDRENVIRELGALVETAAALRQERYEGELEDAWRGLSQKYRDGLSNRELARRLPDSPSPEALFKRQERARSALHVAIDHLHLTPPLAKLEIDSEEARRLHGLVDLLRGRKRGPRRPETP